MKERPILFGGPMVRAILEGKKTQTRRTVKPVGNDGGFVLLDHGKGWWPYRSDDGDSSSHTVKRDGKFYQDETPHACPYGQPGDRLWVREAFCDATTGMEGRILYRADGGVACRWTPSIHMPRWASRITLEITGVRVERLQDISEADAIAEGIERLGEGWERRHCDPDAPVGQPFTRNPVLAYRGLWESINSTGSWDANPWVWIVEFKRVTP